MRKKILLLIAMFALLLPFTVNAAKSNEGYKVMDLKETFDEEGIEIADSNYKETDKQVVIYMFRGNGCGYCRAFLNFLNSIVEENGNMFKLRSYEVWYDQENSSLLKEVAKFTGEEAGGVPYIIIGEKVFPGYIDSWNEDIINAIKTEYDKEKDKRYDVFNEMDKEKNGGTVNGAETKKVIFWTVGSVVVALLVLVLINCLNFSKINSRLDDVYDNLGIERKLSNKEVAELDDEKPVKKSKKRK